MAELARRSREVRNRTKGRNDSGEEIEGEFLYSFEVITHLLLQVRTTLLPRTRIFISVQGSRDVDVKSFVFGLHIFIGESLLYKSLRLINRNQQRIYRMLPTFHSASNCELIVDQGKRAAEALTGNASSYQCRLLTCRANFHKHRHRQLAVSIIYRYF